MGQRRRPQPGVQVPLVGGAAEPEEGGAAPVAEGAPRLVQEVAGQAVGAVVLAAPRLDHRIDVRSLAHEADGVVGGCPRQAQ